MSRRSLHIVFVFSCILIILSMFKYKNLFMKNILVLLCISSFLLVSCGSDPEVVVSGPKWKAPATAAKAPINDSGPANQGSAGLGGGGGGGWGGSKSSWGKKVVNYKAHNRIDDCYTSINSKVYDLTSIIPKFPDLNDQLLSMCGEETTTFYTTKLTSNTELVSAIESSEVQ